MHKPLSGLPLRAEPQLLTMLRAALGVRPQLSLCPPQRTLQSHQHSSSAKPSFVSPLSILFPLPRTLSCVSLMSLLLGSPPKPPKYRLGATAHVLLQHLLSRLSRSFSHYVWIAYLITFCFVPWDAPKRHILHMSGSFLSPSHPAH